MKWLRPYPIIAKRALRKDFTIEAVMDITGLDETTVRKLRVEVDNEMLGVATVV